MGKGKRIKKARQEELAKRLTVEKLAAFMLEHDIGMDEGALDAVGGRGALTMGAEELKHRLIGQLRLLNNQQSITIHKMKDKITELHFENTNLIGEIKEWQRAASLGEDARPYHLHALLQRLKASLVESLDEQPEKASGLESLAPELNFVQSCLTGRASAEDFADYVGRWHDSDSDEEVWAFLGMSEADYNMVVEAPGKGVSELSAIHSVLARL